jgi:hypothetical protein
MKAVRIYSLTVEAESAQTRAPDGCYREKGISQCQMSEAEFQMNVKAQNPNDHNKRKEVRSIFNLFLWFLNFVLS